MTSGYSTTVKCFSLKLIALVIMRHIWQFYDTLQPLYWLTVYCMRDSSTLGSLPHLEVHVVSLDSVNNNIAITLNRASSNSMCRCLHIACLPKSYIEICKFEDYD